MENTGQPNLPRVRIVIADDHHIVRDALRKRLSAEYNLDVVGEVAHGGELWQTVLDTQPDLVLMDADMPQHDPAQAILRIRELDENIKVIILSMHGTARYVIGTVQAGVDGYVLKDDPAEALLHAIQQVMSGRRWISPGIATILAHLVQNGATGNDLDVLTPRERQVLTVLAKGYRNDQIGEVLVISENTVRNHIASIFQKLQVETRVEAVVYALSQGLITLDEIA